ncbi:DUF2867 domain-containing protein, partial [Nonomuraea sp. NPDC055795]
PASPVTLACRTEGPLPQRMPDVAWRAGINLSWLPTGDGTYHLRCTALVKPNGLFGRLYMAAIAPFRHLIVYPALTRQWERAWRDRARLLSR